MSSKVLKALVMGFTISLSPILKASNHERICLLDGDECGSQTTYLHKGNVKIHNGDRVSSINNFWNDLGAVVIGQTNTSIVVQKDNRKFGILKENVLKHFDIYYKKKKLHLEKGQKALDSEGRFGTIQGIYISYQRWDMGRIKRVHIKFDENVGKYTQSYSSPDSVEVLSEL